MTGLAFPMGVGWSKDQIKCNVPLPSEDVG